ncbi:MAG: NAD-dependent epimerase/dehydratase family protein [Verrucomicrobiota bacterium]
MDTIFVTGGSSSLGSSVIRGLLPGFRILASTHRSSLMTADDRLELLQGGLEKCRDHASSIQTAQVIVHLAAVTHSDDESHYFHVNHELTCRLLEVCRPEQHFVLVSSQCAHPQGGPYGRSKWLAEEAVRSSGLPHTILRPSEIYGSTGMEGIDALIAFARKRHLMVDFRDDGHPVRYSPVSLDEVAACIVKSATFPVSSSEPYALCNDLAWTASEMAVALRKSIRPLAIVPVPVRLLRGVARLRIPLPFKLDQLDRLTIPKTQDNSPAKRDFGFHPRSFLSYLAETASPNCIEF